MKIISTLIVLFFSVVAFAQNGSITGVVTDNGAGEKIPFATVSVYPAENNNLAGGSVSNDKGKFEIEKLAFGSYKVVVSFIGYETKTVEPVVISGSKPHVSLGEISISPSSVELGNIDVQGVASTSVRKIDRQTYRASDFETASGGTAVDVLNKLPSVSVSPDGAVSVRGTTDFMVYLNGKPTQMEASVLLGQIAASTIENIDVITVPTARFDAQGKGGIINITTKKTGQDGLSVSANGLLGGAPWGNITDKYSGFQLNDNRSAGGLNILYRKNKVSLYGGLNLNNRNVNGSRTGDARLLQADGTYYHMVAGGERPEWYNTYSANAGIDFNISEKSTLSASYFFGNRVEGRSAFYVYNNFFADINKNPVAGIPTQNHWVYNPNTDERTGVFNTANIDFTQKLGGNSELKISFLYEHSELKRELDNQDLQFDKNLDKTGSLLRHFRETDSTPLNGYRFSVDYSKNLDNGAKISAGFQPQVISHSGAFNYDTLNAATSLWGSNSKFNNFIDMSRAVYAGYLDYSGNAGKLSYVAGFRLEYTDQSLHLDNPDYLNIFNRPTQPLYEVNQLDWFPTLHLKYAQSENNAFIFAASRRINRPPTKNLAPFLYRRHYEVYEVGDPELQPEYLTNYELSWDRKLGNQSLTLTGFYRGTDNAVFRVNTVYDVEKVLIRSYTNSGNVNALGAELNASLSAGKKVKFFVGGSLYNFKVEGDVFGYRENNQSTNWSLKGNMNVQLVKELKFTADFDYKSASVTTQGRNESRFFTNMALNYNPAKLKGWEFSARMLDVLSTNIEALNTRAYNAAGKQIFYQEVEYDRFGTIVEIGAAYSLNMNGKSRKKADSTFGKEQF